MCNVVALTFYATIYEDLCCNCNKYIEKKHTHCMASFLTFVFGIARGGVGLGEGFDPHVINYLHWGLRLELSSTLELVLKGL